MSVEHLPGGGGPYRLSWRRRQPRRTDPLVTALHSGDPDAFAEIHDRHGPAVHAYLRAALRDAGAAEDVHQEVFLEGWRRGPSFDPARGSLVGWIMVIARSRAIDHLRRRVPEPVDPASPDAEAAHEAAVAADSPDLLLERWRMASLLARLPEVEARMLRMRFHEDLSQVEIAERTGIPLGTVKTYMVRALRRLRAMIDEGP